MASGGSELTLREMRSRYGSVLHQILRSLLEIHRCRHVVLRSHSRGASFSAGGLLMLDGL